MSEEKAVAVVGASRNRGKFGNKAVRAYRDQGYRVFPVNPKEEEIEGLRAYPSLADVPAKLDRITVYLPPEVTRKLLPELAAAGAQEVWFNPGSATPEVVHEAQALGLTVRQGCSIVDIGRRPGDYPG